MCRELFPSKLGRSSKGTTCLQLSVHVPTSAPLSFRCTVLPSCSWPACLPSSLSPLQFLLLHQTILYPALADYIVPLHVDVSMIPLVHCTYCCSVLLTFPIQNCYAAVAAGTCLPFSPEGQSAGLGCPGGTTGWEMLSSQEREQCRAVWGWRCRKVSMQA